MTPKGPSQHLYWTELACHDGTPYPTPWRETRAVTLAATFEAVRTLLGDVAMVITSGYRTPAYNATLEGAAQKSQHVQGRALDVWHPLLEPREMFLRIRRAQRAGQLPSLGGLGLYRTFLHLDVRPQSPAGHLATWAGKGVTVPA